MKQSSSLNVIWVYDGELSTALDKATWISTTKALRTLGCQVALIHIGNKECTSVDGVPVTSLSIPQVYFWGKAVFHIKAIQYIVSHFDETDVVLYHPISVLFFLPIKVWRWVLRRKRPLFVMDIRTVQMESAGEVSIKTRLRKVYFSLTQSIANHWVDGQTAITARLAHYVRVPDKKLWGVWQSGVDAERYQECMTARQWVKPDEAVHLVYIGTLNDGRNVAVFAQAVIEAWREGHKLVFTVIGDGFERPMIEKYSQEYAQVIQYVPPVPHREIPNWLSKAHVGVLPFPDEVKFHVSSPIKLFEYMASGIPILATRIVSHVDFLGDGSFTFWAVNSTVSGFKKTLDDVWVKRFQLVDMGKEAVEKAQAWTWLEAARKLRTALEYGLRHYG